MALIIGIMKLMELKKMSKKSKSERGWWKLSIEGVDELNDVDREHIAKLIIEGYSQGEIIHEGDD
jgi:hypothetical protein